MSELTLLRESILKGNFSLASGANQQLDRAKFAEELAAELQTYINFLNRFNKNAGAGHMTITTVVSGLLRKAEQTLCENIIIKGSWLTSGKPLSNYFFQLAEDFERIDGVISEEKLKKRLATDIKQAVDLNKVVSKSMFLFFDEFSKFLKNPFQRTNFNRD